MPFNRRRRLLIAALLFVVLVGVVEVFLLVRGRDIKSRSDQVTVGMTREEVEAILGPPELFVDKIIKPGGRKEEPGWEGPITLVWVDQFWQVEVQLGPDRRVKRIGYMPAYSLYRRTLGRLIDPGNPPPTLGAPPPIPGMKWRP